MHEPVAVRFCRRIVGMQTAILKVNWRAITALKQGFPTNCAALRTRAVTHGVKAAVHRRTWSVFVYIKLGTEVGERGKLVEKKVKRKSTCRDDEIISLIEGIGNEKSILMSKLQNSVTNNNKWSLARGELTAKVDSLGMALRTEDDLNKRGQIWNMRSLNALRDQGKVVGRPPSTPPLYADIIMDTIGEGTDMAMWQRNWWWVFTSSQTNDYCLWCVLYFQVSSYYVQFLIYCIVFSAKKK